MCDCTKVVDENLRKAGNNFRIKIPWRLDGRETPMLRVETPEGKEVKQALFCTFYPFCGERYEPKSVEVETNL